jgi:hypothetical protein
MVSPLFSLWESEPQGKPMGQRVEDVGKSESHSVIEWIGVKNLDDVIVVTLSKFNIIPYESRQTSNWFPFTKGLVR